MLLAYFAVIPIVFYWTEVRQLPEWLRFPPFNCRKCLTFWTLIGISLVIGLPFELYWLMGTGIIMAILTAIAMTVEQKNKTIKL
jgi:hypothetical protein